MNEIHSSATKKNKEWQEKLPIVVLKSEEIMYSKANSEVISSIVSCFFWALFSISNYFIAQNFCGFFFFWVSCYYKDYLFMFRLNMWMLVHFGAE